MQSTGDSILARHECQNHRLHPEMRRLYVTSEEPDQGTVILSVMSPHQGPGRKLPLTYSHLMTRIISAQ